MANRDASMDGIIARRLCGHPSTGPSGVAPQSIDRMRAPLWPPPSNRLTAEGPADTPGSYNHPGGAGQGRVLSNASPVAGRLSHPAGGAGGMHAPELGRPRASAPLSTVAPRRAGDPRPDGQPGG